MLVLMKLAVSMAARNFEMETKAMQITP